MTDMFSNGKDKTEGAAEKGGESQVDWSDEVFALPGNSSSEQFAQMMEQFSTNPGAMDAQQLKEFSTLLTAQINNVQGRVTGIENRGATAITNGRLAGDKHLPDKLGWV